MKFLFDHHYNDCTNTSHRSCISNLFISESSLFNVYIYDVIEIKLFTATYFIAEFSASFYVKEKIVSCISHPSNNYKRFW